MRYWIFWFSFIFVLASGVLMGLAIKLDLPSYITAFLWIIAVPTALASIIINYFASKAIIEDWRNK